jgi:hypothetical protein
MRDTRVYVEHDSKRVIRQYTAKEGKAPLLPTIEDRTEVYEIP